MSNKVKITPTTCEIGHPKLSNKNANPYNLPTILNYDYILK